HHSAKSGSQKSGVSQTISAAPTKNGSAPASHPTMSGRQNSRTSTKPRSTASKGERGRRRTAILSRSIRPSLRDAFAASLHPGDFGAPPGENKIPENEDPQPRADCVF